MLRACRHSLSTQQIRHTALLSAGLTRPLGFGEVYWRLWADLTNLCQLWIVWEHRGARQTCIKAWGQICGTPFVQFALAICPWLAADLQRQQLITQSAPETALQVKCVSEGAQYVVQRRDLSEITELRTEICWTEILSSEVKTFWNIK